MALQEALVLGSRGGRRSVVVGDERRAAVAVPSVPGPREITVGINAQNSIAEFGGRTSSCVPPASRAPQAEKSRRIDFDQSRLTDVNGR
jgi:hypothetical protein